MTAGAAGILPAAAATAPARGFSLEPADDVDAAGRDAGPLSIDEVRAAARVIDLPLTEDELPAVHGSLAGRREAMRSAGRPTLAETLAPAETFRPLGLSPASATDLLRRSVASAVDPGPLPADPGRIMHRPLTHLAVWLRRGDLTARRLAGICLDRISRHDGRLRAIVTATGDLAMDQAARADAERAAGRDRGILHGLPYGAKDLFDTAGIRTTWGATPYADRVPDTDAAVIRRLEEAGAVLVAKTSLGALAYGDQWFGGRTANPWDLEQGSSGSSAGSAAGIAAGLFAFSLGTETYGSIVSPSMRCGTTGLRPTFGRVARTGAMALCWSLDKVGPICRTVEDCVHVLAAIDGADAGDPSSLDLALDFDPTRPLAGRRVGVDRRWFDGPRTAAADRAALAAMQRLAATPDGPELVDIEGPSTEHAGDLLRILEVEAAAAFQHLTLSGEDDQLVWQAPEAWPNTFRAAHFHSAVDLLQSMRMRRTVAERMDAVFADLDAILAPSFAGGLNLMTNFTGHPCLVLRSGFDDRGRPRGVSLFGRLGDDAALAELGVALERELGVADRTPPGF
ncbi:MAG: amidase [Planctomycetota bacterium]|jgi:Asp-tRNA(Asn)/Glu-tRNA(Gln) amidotransferase A subunit family amidase